MHPGNSQNIEQIERMDAIIGKAEEEALSSWSIGFRLVCDPKGR